MRNIDNLAQIKKKLESRKSINSSVRLDQDIEKLSQTLNCSPTDVSSTVVRICQDNNKYHQMLETIVQILGCKNDEVLQSINSLIAVMPVVKKLMDELNCNENEIEGILNSSVNYILGSIFTKHISFKKALEDAQALGYTKPDYNNDLLGKDAAYKLALIYNKAYAANISIKDIFIKGIKYLDEETIMFARLHETQIHLVAYMNRNNAYVIPYFTRKKDLYNYVKGKSNCIMIETQNVGKLYDIAQSVGIKAITNAICLDLIRPLHNEIIYEANIINDNKYHFYLSEQIIDDKYIDLKTGKGCITIFLSISELASLIQNHHIFVGALLDEEYRYY